MNAVELCYELHQYRPMTRVAISVGREKGREVFIPADLTVAEIVGSIEWDEYGGFNHGKPVAVLVEGAGFEVCTTGCSSEAEWWAEVEAPKGNFAILYVHDAIPTAVSVGREDRVGFLTYQHLREQDDQGEPESPPAEDADA